MAACHEKWLRLSTEAPAPVIQPSIQASPPAWSPVS